MHIKCISILAAVCLISGCRLTLKDPAATDSAGTGTTTEETTSLFKEQSDGSYTFETNDSAYTNKDGYTLWTITQTISNTQTFAPFSTAVVKSHGNTGYGYGVIFNANTNSSGKTSLLCVLIRTTGEFAVGKVENGLYSDIQYWTENSYIKQGLGVDNIITIAKLNESNEYSVTFNGSSDSTVKFSDTGSYIYSNGSRGYVVVLAPDENFPTNRVVVSFAEK